MRVEVTSKLRSITPAGIVAMYVSARPSKEKVFESDVHAEGEGEGEGEGGGEGSADDSAADRPDTTSRRAALPMPPTKMRLICLRGEAHQAC